MNNYKRDPSTMLTSHALAAGSNKQRSVSGNVVPRPRRKREIDPATLPAVGDVITLDVSRFHQATESSTPITKVRRIDNVWQQVDHNSAGLMLFIDEMPAQDCTSFTVTSIIPTGTACYIRPS